MLIKKTKALFITMALFLSSSVSAQQNVEFLIYLTSPNNSVGITVPVEDIDSPVSRCEAIATVFPIYLPNPTGVFPGRVAEVTEYRGGGTTNTCNVNAYQQPDPDEDFQGPYRLTLNYIYEQSTPELCPDGLCNVYYWGDLRFGVDGLILPEEDFSNINTICQALEVFRVFEYRPIGDRVFYHEFQEWLGSGAFFDDRSGYCDFNLLSFQVYLPDNSVIPGSVSPSVLNFSLDLPPAPDPEAECQGVNSELCCYEYAIDVCSSEGGLNSYSYGGPSSSPNSSCTFLCNNDLEPDPIPPPDEGYDLRPYLSEANAYLRSIDNNTDLSLDTLKSILNSIDSLELDVDTLGITNELQEINQLMSDFLAGQITIEDLDVLLDGLLSGLTFEVDGVEVDFSGLESLAIEANQSLSNLETLGIHRNQTLDSLLSALTDTTTDGVPDPDSLDWDMVLDGIDEDGNIIDTEYWQQHGDTILTTLGLDLDASIDDLQLDEIYLDDIVNSANFNFDLGPTDCPAPYQMTFLETDFSFEFTGLCEVTEVLGYFVILAALFMVPYIVFSIKG